MKKNMESMESIKVDDKYNDNHHNKSKNKNKSNKVAFITLRMQSKPI